MRKRSPKQLISAMLAAVMLLMTVPVTGLVHAATTISVAEWSFANIGTNSVIPATGGVYATQSTVTLSTYNGNPRTLSYTASSRTIYASGWDNGANSKYWQIQTSASGYEHLKLTFNSYGTSTSPKDFKLQYSLDNTQFMDIDNGAYQNTASNTTTKTDFPLPTAIEDNTTVYLRFLQTSNDSIGGGTVAAGGNSRISDIKITGQQKADSATVAAVTAAPDGQSKIALGGAVTLSTVTADASIVYTLNGGEPQTIAGTSGDVVVNAFNQTGDTAIIKAKAVKGTAESAERTFVYTQAQLDSVSASKTGSVADGAEIFLISPKEGAAISYALTRKAGTIGESADPEKTYNGPITLTKDMLPAKIEAFATLNGYKNSITSTFNYTLKDGSKEAEVYFGQLHGHTTQSDGSGTMEEAYTYARDVAKLDFFALTDHSNYFDTSTAPVEYKDSFTNTKWLAGQAAAAAAKTESFIPFYGYEMTWAGGPGHINTFATEGFVSRNNKSYASGVTAMKNYYELLKTIPGSIGQFNHPGPTFGDFNNFSNYDPEINKHMTLIEVGNGEGAINSGGYFRSIQYYNNALDKGWHLAPTNNQDNHKGRWGDANTARTAIVTDNFTTEGVYDALREMRVYATEDSNLKIKYTANDELLGTSLPAGIPQLKIKADISDADLTDKIGDVSIVTTGGKELHQQKIAENSGIYTVNIDNPVNGYYYLKVVEADGDIAVTAPVWVGEIEKVGINAVAASVSMPVTGEALDLSVDVFNNEASAITVESVDYSIGGSSIGTHSLNASVASLGTLSDKVSYTPAIAGTVPVTVTVKAIVNNDSRTFTQVLDLKVRDSAKLINIGLDASHLNEYVAGNYANSMTNLARMAEEYDIRVVEVKGGLTEEKLSGLEALIITPPNRKTSVGALGEYTEDELKAIKAFADSGKTLIVNGLADYGDGKTEEKYHAAFQQNRILELLQSKTRLVDDELIDNVNYVPSQNFRLRFKNYNMDSIYNAGVNPEQEYSFYSGSSIEVKEADRASVTTIVYSHATSESLDSDKDGKGGEGNPIVKGNIPVLTVEKLASGAKLFVAGSVFMSNFEVQATIDNSEDLGYSNYNITENILKEIAPKEVTPIASVQLAAEGQTFTIQGTLTSNASGYDQNTAFFDSVYVQDGTAGINLFPVAGNFKAGQKVEVSGTVGAYNGEKQLTVSSIKLIDEQVREITPKHVTTAEAILDATRGSLVQVEGIVKSVSLDSGKVGSIVVNDGTGDVRVFIDGYITPSIYLESLQEGDRISAVGLSSVDAVGKRIRVRNRNEIKVIPNALMSKIAGYSTGFSATEGGVAEIVKYNSDNQKFYLVNGKEKKVDIVSLSGLKSSGNAALQLDKRIDVSQMIQGFTFGDITSVDINTSLKRIAIAVQEADYSKAGAVILLDYDGNFQDSYATGVQPDMVTFTPDGKYLLTADEGEPRQGYAGPAVDPKGSVTIVDLTTHTAKVVDFTSFDDTNARAGLLANNVILKKTTAPSVDLEPEYAAVSADSKKAYITLQEANAIATLDIEKGIFTAIKGLGFKDHSLAGNEIDMRRDGKIDIKTEANVLGMFNPDGITSYTVGGKTYLLTANEGDSRDWNGYLNEKDISLGKGQDGDATKTMKVTAFDTSGYEVGTNGSGFDSGKTYLFGARSFSVWDADTLSLVYDSGADFEKVTAKLLPQYFNWSNDDLVFEKRSAKKGPEPEDVKVGIVDGKPYAFIGLERVGGNMMYDLSDVAKPVFSDYLNTRDFANSVDNSGSKPAYVIAGDVSPEGQAFIPANLSPTRYPLLLVANEVSGTVSVVEIPKGLYTPDEPGTSPTPTPTPTQQPSGTQSPVNSATPSPAASPSATPAAGTTAVIKPSFNSETGEAKLTLNAETAAKLLANAAVSEQAGQHAVVEISSEAVSNAKKVSLELGSDFLQKLAGGTNADLKMNTGFGTITLGNAAVDAIGKSAQGQPISVSVEAAATGSLSSGVQALIGGRPVYSFTITAGASNITTFGGEALKVTIPYTPKAGENSNAILVYYIDGSGNAVPVISKFNPATQTVEFATTHFSTFAVAYNPITFADSANHWGKDSIAFIAARGVLTGLSADQFGPNQTMTRGMLATVLGKLANVDPSGGVSFSDVSATKYYAPYVAWAAQNNIVKGTGNGKFAPDQAVTRQELAVVLYNYLAYSGGKLSAAATASEFADAGSIAAWAKEAVSAIQAGGLINGKPGNTFDPQGTATRAEVASVLQKYIEQSLTN